MIGETVRLVDLNAVHILYEYIRLALQRTLVCSTNNNKNNAKDISLAFVANSDVGLILPTKMLSDFGQTQT